VSYPTACCPKSNIYIALKTWRMADPYKFPAKYVGVGSINISSSRKLLKALRNIADFLTCYLLDRGLWNKSKIMIIHDDNAHGCPNAQHENYTVVIFVTPLVSKWTTPPNSRYLLLPVATPTAYQYTLQTWLSITYTISPF
jgi:hypothetical protein